METAESTEQSAPVSEGSRVLRDTVLNCVGKIASILPRFVLVPLMLLRFSGQIYGVWITAFALSETATFFGNGLCRAVSYRVASDSGSTSQQGLTEFIQAAEAAFFLLGILGAVYIFVAGLGISTQFHLGADDRKTTICLVSFVAVSFAVHQTIGFSMEVLTGLRRFDVINAVGIIHTMINAAGMVMILVFWPSVTLLAMWMLCCTFAVAVASRYIVWQLRPEWRISVQCGLSPIRPYLGFGGMSQLIAATNWMILGIGPFLVGLIRGPAAIVPFEIGRKIPATMEVFGWTAAEAVYPASGECARTGDVGRARQILKAGTRLQIGLIFPMVITLWFVGPHLLTVWLQGRVVPEALLIFRILLAWILVDAVSTASFQFLWGRGDTKRILTFTAVGGSLSAAVAIVLLRSWGVGGVAVATLVGATVSGACACRAASKYCEIRPTLLIREAFRRTWLPLTLTAAVAFSVSRMINSSWPAVLAGAICPLAFFTFVYAMLAADDEERAAFRNLAKVFRSTADRARSEGKA